MTSGNSGKNSLRKADAFVAITGVLVAACVYAALTRSEGFLTAAPAGRSPAAAPGKAPGAAQSQDDPTRPANVNQAYHVHEQGHKEELAENRKAAIDLYTKACKLDPQRKFYWSSLASVAFMDGRLDIAYPAYLEVYNLDVYDAFNLTRLGYVANSMRKEEDARRYYLMALCVQSDFQEAWDETYNLSHDYPWNQYSQQIHQASMAPTKSENNELVYTLNQFALNQHPDDYYYLVNRVLINLRFMRLQTVGADIDKALKINPRGPAALLARAQLYNLQGQYDKALQAYKDCIAVSPQPLAYAELGSLEMQKGNIDEALRAYKTATDLGNDKPSWVTTLNKLIEMKKKRDEEAQNQARKSGSKV